MKKVYFTCGGGLGDCIIGYLNDKHAVDFRAKTWFRRIKDLKEKENPKIQIILTSHCSSAKDLFKPNPYIDEIKLVGWQIDEITEKQKKEWTDFLPIDAVYKHANYNSSPVKFYITEENKRILEQTKPKSRYVVIHPFARKSGRELPFNHYYELIKRLSDKNIKSIVIGASYRLRLSEDPENEKIIEESFPYQHKDLANLVNKTDITLVPHLILGADGFIGTHSSWILLSWHYEKPTISMFPDHTVKCKEGKLPWIEYKKKHDPYMWGVEKNFNKVCSIENEKTKVDYDKLVNFLAR